MLHLILIVTRFDLRLVVTRLPVAQVPSQHGTRECFIRIQPTWLDDQYNQNLYISYRRSEGADQDLELVGTGAFADKVMDRLRSALAH